MNPEKDPHNVYWCSKVIFQDKSHGWVLFRHRVIPVADTGWTVKPADDTRQGPEKVAYKQPGEPFWIPAEKMIPMLGTALIDERTREDIPEEEALAIMLMIKNTR